MMSGPEWNELGPLFKELCKKYGIPEPGWGEYGWQGKMVRLLERMDRLTPPPSSSKERWGPDGGKTI